MTVIAMTREMGTLGSEVAIGLAEAMGLEVVDHELVEHHLAERLHLSEDTVHRFLEGSAPVWERWRIDAARMSRYTADEVLGLASRGNVVIRGWGAAQLLAGISHVLRVRICAPMTRRIAIMTDRLGNEDVRSVRHMIERGDDAQTRTIQRQFDVDWRDPAGYDIVLNTGCVTVGTCVDIIRRLAESGAYEETAASRGILADKRIQADVRRILDTYASDTPFGSAVEVSVSGGAVHLSGVVNGFAQVGKAVEEIERLDGVTAVDNKVFAVPARSGV